MIIAMGLQEGSGSFCLISVEFQSEKMKRRTEMNYVIDGCTTIGMHLMTLNCTFRMVEMVNFVVYVL